MPEINVSQVGTIPDARVKRIVNEIANTVRLAAEKATANAVDPNRYPLSARRNSLERIFSDRLATLAPAQRERAEAFGRGRLALSGATRRREYGRLTRVSLTDRTAVEDQVLALRAPSGLRLSRAQLEVAVIAPVNLAPAIFRPARARLPVGRPSQQLPDAPRRLEFRLHELFCADETGGNWFTEHAGSDEIYLGGSAIDATGVTSAIPSSKVGDFDDGDRRQYSPPRVMTTFDLTRGRRWPKSYFVVLALAEKDMGGFAAYLNRLVDAIKDHVIAKLAATIGGSIGVASGGPIGAAIGVAVGYAIGKAIEWLRAAWGDDIFSPVTVNVEIGYPSARFGTSTHSPEVVARFTGHDADYRLSYDWRLTNFGPAPPPLVAR